MLIDVKGASAALVCIQQGKIVKLMTTKYIVSPFKPDHSRKLALISHWDFWMNF